LVRKALLVAVVALVLGVRAASAQDAGPQQTLPPQHPEAPSKPKPAAWKESLNDSLRMLAVQHAIRIAFQEKTRAYLGGPFFGDYHRSVKFPKQWSDGDSWGTTYIGHPIQGATTEFIWLTHSKNGVTPFSWSHDYMKSRLQATMFAFASSVQWKIGPLSEASIGNVGLDRAHLGWADHVTTPGGGLLVVLAEDAADRFVVSKIDQRLPPFLGAMLRMTLTPSRTWANVMSLEKPWYRPGRDLW
jgi:hypothetical protein